MKLLKYHSSLPPDHDDDGDNSETIAPPVKKLKGIAAVLKHVEVENSQQSTDTLTHQQQIDQEITSYLDFPAFEADTDPLTWKVESRKRKIP